MIHQHFTLAENLTVLDNVMLGMRSLWDPRSGRAAIRRRLETVMSEFGLRVDPAARLADLSIGERQRVEILKALIREARILVLDEPTAVLTPQEARTLFETLARLTARGLSLIFISHKLEEVMRVADRVAVLKQGRKVYEAEIAQTSRQQLAQAMVGEALATLQPRADGAAMSRVGAPVLTLADVTVSRSRSRSRSRGRSRRGERRLLLDRIDLVVHGGEIVAIAGVSGNGQQALADLLAGERATARGSLTVAGRALAARPRDWIRAGVARIPVDRLHAGVIGDASVAENAIVSRLPRWFVDRRAMHAGAQEIVDRYDVRLRSLSQPIRLLSGGNIQKFIVGRELSAEPRLIVACQPTWGLDIGAVAFVHERLRVARDRGAAVLLISEDLEEIFALADRTAVIHGGHLGPARPTDEWTAEAIGLAMAGAVGAGSEEGLATPSAATMPAAAGGAGGR
jgi:simple sugar transport system ATP-binding protein